MSALMHLAMFYWAGATFGAVHAGACLYTHAFAALLQYCAHGYPFLHLCMSALSAGLPVPLFLCMHSPLG